MTNTLVERVTLGMNEETRPWSRLAACAGKTQLFYPAPGERPEPRAARELRAALVCDVCPVKNPCRDWARDHREYGFWGGESEEAREAAGFRVRFPSTTRRSKRNPAA